jgi:predicted ATPase/DNA-binding CsgD family transcriptional regulator
MVSTIADAMGFQFYGERDPKQQLLDYLRDRHLLLLLDNFEHLLDGASIVSDILAGAPGVKALVTSRERLNLVEEWVFDVPGLPFPLNEMDTEIEAYSAVQLFVQNARRAQVGFGLTDTHKPAVNRICRVVGGMPLGIELAAAWVRALSCEQIAAELERSLDILETPARNVEPRHRTMRVVFDPTWERLSKNERTVFMKLSVFRGGFTREGAEYVAGATLRTLSALVDKSLVCVDATGRYEMHELLRQYGEEQLNASADERSQVADLHCTYYAEFLDQRWQHLRGPSQKETLREIDIEIENLRVSWRWAVVHNEQETVGKALESLWFFYNTRGRYAEGEQVFRMAVEALTVYEPDAVQSVTVGKLAARLGAFYFSLRLAEPARPLLLNSLAIFTHHGARGELAHSLLRLGEVAMYLENDYPQAQQHLQKSRALYQEIGDQQGQAFALARLGMAAYYLGDFREARRLGQEALARCEGPGSRLERAVALILLSSTAIELGEYQEAKRLGLESLAIGKEIGIYYVVNHTLIVLGNATCALGEYPESRRYFCEALKMAREAWFYTPYLLVGIASLLAELGQKERALSLLALVLHHSAHFGMGKHIGTRLRARLEADLPPETFTTASERARALDLDATVNALLEEFSQSVQEVVPSPSQSIGRDPAANLNEREREILRLIADGLSTREVAQELFLTVGTVRWYLKQIYGKLYVHSRTQAINRARELNLLA